MKARGVRLYGVNDIRLEEFELPEDMEEIDGLEEEEGEIDDLDELAEAELEPEAVE